MTQQDGKTILITGAAGFIGYHLARSLLLCGYRVAGADSMNDYYDPALKCARLKELLAFERFSFIEGDLADAGLVERLFIEAKPNVVVHLAAQAGVRYSIENPRAYIESNVVGFFNVLDAVRAHPVEHFLFASSSSVYGNRDKTPFSVEDRVDKPVSLYAATKKSDELMAYTYAHLFGVPATGLRFFTVYGPFGRPDMAYFKFTKAILAGKPIDVYNGGDMLRDFTYIDDVTSCLERMLFAPPKPDETGAPYALYNIGNNKPVRLLDFIRALEDALGKKAELIYLPMQPGDVGKTYADISETRRDFGFEPATQIDEGLRRFAAWYRAYYYA
ncbi:MAG: NAD-dependent epimerase/dehydratase family protein [Clostridiales bacterium]|nr:NAD-dependent epimerase/dehydratase family protein [Clostridiales bacterium]